MHPLLLGAVLALAYAIALAALAPAFLLDVAAATATGGRVRIAEASGSLWRGRGSLELRSADLRGAVRTSIVWRVETASVFPPRVEVALAQGGAAPAALLAATPGGAELTHLRWRLPASVLALVHPQLAAMQPTGAIEIAAPRLTWRPPALNGAGVVRWSAAGLGMASVSPSGEYELAFESVDSSIGVSLRTARGAVVLNGAGRWRLGERPVFDSTATIEPAARARLEPLLRLVGVETQPGQYALRVR